MAGRGAILVRPEWARGRGHHAVHVRSDSLLLVEQMRGRYKVRNAGLQPLYGRARLLAHELGRVTFEHVGRSLNEHADRLANTAMDDAAKPRQSWSMIAASIVRFARRRRHVRNVPWMVPLDGVGGHRMASAAMHGAART